MEFCRRPSKHWNPVAILIIIAILNLSFHCNHWNSDPILPNIRNPALSLSLQTFEFWPLFTNIGILIEFLHTLEFWPCFLQTGIFSSFFRAFEFWPSSYKHWNSYLILSLETLKLWPYPSKQWNYGPIFIYTSKYWDSGPISISIGIMILCFQRMKFEPSFYKHLNSDLILPNTGILILSFETFEFWPYILHMKILMSSFQTLEIWPYFYKHWNSCVILWLQKLEFWPYLYAHWNSYLILPNVGILALLLYTTEFLPNFYKHCNCYLIHPLQTLKFSPYTHWFSDGMLQDIRILPRFF